MNKLLSMQEIRTLYIDMLDYLAKFCDDHKIKYYLAYGTLLGAVRHEGFIPWDDDVDIVMPRCDFEKFIKCFSEEQNGKSLYELQFHNTLSNYIYPYAKLRDIRTIKEPVDTNLRYVPEEGLDIDIFPLDGISNNMLKAYVKYKFTNILFHKIYLNLVHSIRLIKLNKFKQYFARFVLHLISPSRMASLFYKYYPDVCYDKCKEIGVMPLCNSLYEHLPKDYYGEGMYLKFENKEFRVPQNYIRVLEMYYGKDFMTPPPIENRASTHDSKIFYKNNNL